MRKTFVRLAAACSGLVALLVAGGAGWGWK
jgi:hypothetical protein